MTLGSDDFGLRGDFNIRVISQYRDSGADIGTYCFELSGSAGVSVRAFGISLGGINVGFRFVLDTKDGVDGEVPIRLTVRVEVDFGLFSIGGDATFTIGYLRVPKPIYLGSDGTNSNRGWNGGLLTLNVGSPTAALGAQHRSRGRPSETYIIEQVSGDKDRGSIKVTAFGRSTTYDNVTKVVGNFGDGNDTIIIRDNVVLPVEIDGGEGNDVITFAGSNLASVHQGRRGRRLPVDRRLGHARGWRRQRLPDPHRDRYGDPQGRRGRRQALRQHGHGRAARRQPATTCSRAGPRSTRAAPEATCCWSPSTGSRATGWSSGATASTTRVGDRVAGADSSTSVNKGYGDWLMLSFGSANDNVKVTSAGANALSLVWTTSSATTLDLTGFEALTLDGGAGADSFRLGDLAGAGVKYVNVRFGRLATNNGTKTVETAPGSGQTMIVPDIRYSDDRAADSLTIEGTANRDGFTLVDAVDQGIDSLPAVRVTRRQYNATTKAFDVLAYHVDVAQSLRSERDAVTVAGLAGDDVIDASGLTVDRAALTLERRCRQRPPHRQPLRRRHRRRHRRRSRHRRRGHRRVQGRRAATTRWSRPSTATSSSPTTGSSSAPCGRRPRAPTSPPEWSSGSGGSSRTPSSPGGSSGNTFLIGDGDGRLAVGAGVRGRGLDRRGDPVRRGRQRHVRRLDPGVHAA